MSTQIIIAIITATLSVATATILAFVNHRNNKKIEELKSAIEQKSKKDNEIFQFLLTYETETINKYLIALKDILQCSQEIKDRTRQLLSNKTLVDVEKRKHLDSLKEKIIGNYSKHVYYLNQSKKNSIAHSLKNLVIDLVSLNSDTSPEEVEELVTEISDKQILLQKEVNNKINEALSAVRSKV